MATDPNFGGTVNNGAQLLGGAETSTTVPTTTSTIVAAGASGSKVEEVVVEGTGTTVAGLVYLFLHDGTTYHLFDTVTVTAFTASTTAPPFRARNVYTNLWVMTGWSLRASQSIAGNASILKVHAFAGDF